MTRQLGPPRPGGNSDQVKEELGEQARYYGSEDFRHSTPRSRTAMAMRSLSESGNSISRFVLVAMVTLTSGCALVADKSMTQEDHQECEALESAVLEKHSVPQAALEPGRSGKAIYCGIVQTNPFLIDLRTHITLYGVVEPSEQDRILATVRDARGPRYKPVRIDFFAKEVWETSERDGRVLASRRGQETLLRSEVIR